MFCSGVGTCVVNGSAPSCTCPAGYTPTGTQCLPNSSVCAGVLCSGHGTCSEGSIYFTAASCRCDMGYKAEGLTCVVDGQLCTHLSCSGHGTCRQWTTGTQAISVCACDPGFTPSTAAGNDCVPTSQMCTGGPVNYDFNGDGTVETRFDPTPDECLQYELVNLTRATHNDEGSPECHTPLAYNVEWSAHARAHSKAQADQGGLFHADNPGWQNCAHGGTASSQVNMYMHGANENHCPPGSHHCNIMTCGTGNVGIGNWPGAWNTQNFF